MDVTPLESSLNLCKACQKLHVASILAVCSAGSGAGYDRLGPNFKLMRNGQPLSVFDATSCSASCSTLILAVSNGQ